MPATDAVQQRVIPQRKQRHHIVEKLPLSRPPAQGLWGELRGVLPNNKSRVGGAGRVRPFGNTMLDGQEGAAVRS